MTVSGNTDTGNPTGTVTFSLCDGNGGNCNQIGAPVNVGASGGDAATATSQDVTPSSPGTYCFSAAYSGDANYTSSGDASAGECFTVTQADTATVSSPAWASVVLGNANHDSVSVKGNQTGGSPTGTVTFFRCGPAVSDCSSGGTQLGNAVPLTSAGGSVATADSPDTTPSSAGTYCFRAVYGGDSNYNGSSDGSAANECFTVTKADTASASSPTSSTRTLGQTNSDSVTVTGNATGGSPTGSVTFFLCGPSATDCTSGGTQVGNAVALTGGAAGTATATSDASTPSALGDYCYRAEYGGDSNYNTSSDSDSSECFTVGKAGTTSASQPSSQTFKLDDSNTDKVTVTGNATGGSPTGTVTFFLCGPPASDCTTGGTQVGNTIAVTAGANNTATATSDAASPSSPGTYCYRAHYNGDSNYEASSDGSAGECFTVTKADSSSSSAPRHGSVQLGSSNIDDVVVDGNGTGGHPTGTVTFFICGPSASDCSSGGTQVGNAVALAAGSGNTSKTSSDASVPSALGTYCYRAEYSGDGNYTASTDGSSGECFSVTTADTASVSTPASATFKLGGSNSDSITVTGNATGGSPTGSVGFFLCGPGVSDCSSGGTLIGSPVALTAGSGNTATAKSDTSTPSAPGTYCYRAVYGGDSNYNSSTDGSAGECFTVTKADTTSTSAPAHASIVLADSNTDSVTVKGNATGGSPIGTVTFFRCGPSVSDCATGGTQVGSAVTVAAGSGNTATATSDASTPGAPGTYCFRAEYGGDANYAKSSDGSSGECFTVGKAAVSTSGTPQHASVDVGDSLTDAVTVTGNGTGGSPTGTVAFFVCGPNTGACASGGVPLGSGATLSSSGATTSSATSPVVPATKAGTWCFRAEYSGDANYASASDASSTNCFVANVAGSGNSSNPGSPAVRSLKIVKIIRHHGGGLSVVVRTQGHGLLQALLKHGKLKKRHFLQTLAGASAFTLTHGRLTFSYAYARRTVTKDGTVTLRLKPGRVAQRLLARKLHPKLRLVVVLTTTDGHFLAKSRRFRL